MYEVNFKKIKNTDKFRQPAITFQKYGYYTTAPVGTSEYMQYWDTEMERCLNGFTTDDGDYISGYFYFYLNYCTIMLVKEEEVEKKGRKRKILNRVSDFPRFWDSDKQFFDAVEEAEEQGKHLAVLKARGKGYSYKAASMLCRNFFLVEGSTSLAVASEKEFLVKDGILSKAWEMMNFINENTAWYKKRQAKDTEMHKRASLILNEDGKKVESGYMSEIMGITLKNDTNRIRGKRAKLILYEESGKFPGLLEAWQIARPSVEQGESTYGLQIAFGCVCAGTKIWNNKGSLINIEDLKQEDGIIGYSNDLGAIKESIAHFNPPAKKHCYKIITNTGRSLRCSEDHPILWSKVGFCSSKELPKINGKRRRKYSKKTKFVEAKDIKVGEQIAVIDQVPIFGNKEMWNPRVIGWLIGDGSYGKDKTPRLFNCESEINDYIDKHFNISIEKSHITKEGKLYKETRIKEICYRLRELCIYGQTKLDKTLPIDIHSYDKYSITELLGGLFDTDGYVDKKGGISISSISKNLLLEILLLLQKLGIHGNINKIKMNPNNPRDKNDYYRLEIRSKTSVLRFNKEIKLYPRIKRERLEAMPEYYINKRSEHADYLPYLKFERVVEIESIGMQDVYNLTVNNTNTYVANGIITHNTGGSQDSDFGSLKELFYAPKAYNLLEINNIWDPGAEGMSCGFFIPDYMNSEGYMDEDGNSLIEKAKEYSVKERKKVEENANDRHAIDRYIAERPFTPQEAALQLGGNIFPKKELAQQLARIQTNKMLSNYKQVGELIFDNNGTLKWVQTKDVKDITKYPLSAHEDKTGAIVIWEHPPEDIPYGLYIAGSDTYDHDDSGTGSLGSTFIYKRFQNFESYYDIIVAEYTGRPATADEYYENVRKLLLYYNATLLYENERKGIFPYFTSKSCDHLLADQPDIINDIVRDSKVKRRKGIHMIQSIKDWGEREIRDWLNEEISPGVKQLTRIMSVPLLQELIAYNGIINADRVMAIMMIMIYKKELHKVQVKEKTNQSKSDPFLNGPIFAKERTLNYNLR